MVNHMPKYAVLNTVVGDGMGDFTHFLDIMQALRSNPLYKDVEFVPVVSFQTRSSIITPNKVKREENTQIGKVRVQKSLDTLGYPYILGIDSEEHEELASSEEAKNLLHDADQVIVISSDQDRLLDLYCPLMKAGIPIKLIAEHEAAIGVSDNIETITPEECIIDASLGLAPISSGIKVSEVPELSATAAWQVIKENNPEFVEQVLTSSHSESVEAFQSNHVIAPAYFNKNEDFITFLHRLGVMQSNFKDKDFAIYHSGNDLIRYLTPSVIKSITNAFRNTSIKEIQIINPGDNKPITIKGNPNGTQSIAVYSGFYLKDPAFDALHQLSDIAGVSGDNTFERCISMNILPFYWSTNPNAKAETLRALINITAMPELPLSDKARQSFESFFSPEDYKKNAREMYNVRSPSNSNLSHIDLSVMIKEWPVVCDYIKKHKNFYHELDRIVLARLPDEAKPAAFNILNNNRSPDSEEHHVVKMTSSASTITQTNWNALAPNKAKETALSTNVLTTEQPHEGPIQ